MAEIARRKQAQRDEDERALASGEKTREQLQAENSLLPPLIEIRVRFEDAKPLRARHVGRRRAVPKWSR